MSSANCENCNELKSYSDYSICSCCGNPICHDCVNPYTQYYCLTCQNFK